MAFGECPGCGSRSIRGSKARGAKERLLSVLGWMPFRCRQCELRFNSFLWDFASWRFARCPKCLRSDLTTWSEDHYVPAPNVMVLLRLGARPYRCESCHCNFASFRSRAKRGSHHGGEL